MGLERLEELLVQTVEDLGKDRCWVAHSAPGLLEAVVGHFAVELAVGSVEKMEAAVGLD